MQFYKFEGLKESGNWPDDDDRSRETREKIRKIVMKSEDFNHKLGTKSFFFIEKVSKETVSIGIFCKDSSNIDRLTSDYLDFINAGLKYTSLEEVTFNYAHSMLQHSYHNDYIDDDETVLEQFDLDNLNGRYGRSLDFSESIINSAKKKDIYADAELVLARDTFIPELDRIYAVSPKAKTVGHPVHYLIQTDDRDTRNNMCRTLLQALYTNGRLRSRRSASLSFRPGCSITMTAYDSLYKMCAGGAVIIKYRANDDTEDDHASCDRDTIENICEIMKRYRNQVLTIFCLPRECTRSMAMFYENLGNTSIVELKEEFVTGECAEDFLKVLAKESRVRTDKKLFAKLDKEEGYLAHDLRELFDEWLNSKLKTDVYPQYRDIASAGSEAVKASPKGSAYDELMGMVGLDEAKNVIKRALDCYKAQNIFADKGLKSEMPAMHMIFTGNPGTAKTSVARLFARIMKENGLLSKGKLVETGRGDLVGKYVGWTAPTIKKKFKEAMGGILFIDEAYSLVDDRDGSYGDEAINTIVQEMENHREDVIVIFAGYPDKMEGFLRKNPGLRSRIAFHVPFEDYSTDELCSIAGLIAGQKGFVLAEDTMPKLKTIFELARTEADFGNGRFVRNVIEKAGMSQASRLLKMDYDSIRTEDVKTIRAEDIDIPIKAVPQKNRIGFCY